MKIPESCRVTTGEFGSHRSDGNNGLFLIPHYRINNYRIRCVVCDELGWEHVSVTIAPVNKSPTRCPTWDEMCWVKDQFWNKDEVVIQYHPAEKDYVSQHDYCLHLWRPKNVQLPTPLTLMVGLRNDTSRKH